MSGCRSHVCTRVHACTLTTASCPGALRPGLRLRALSQGKSRKFPQRKPAGLPLLAPPDAQGALPARAGGGTLPGFHHQPSSPGPAALQGRCGVSRKPLALPSLGEQVGAESEPVLGSRVPWEPPSPLPAPSSESQAGHRPQEGGPAQGHLTLLSPETRPPCSQT